METSISVMDAHRLLLADEIAVALAAGASVIATGPGGGNDILGLVAAELAEAGIRNLSLRPPLDAASFAAQFADGWRTAAQGAAMPATGASEKFAVLVHDAHAIPPGALRHLDRLAAAWPNMQLAFAGLHAAAATIRSADYPTLAKRASLSIDIAGPRLRLTAAPAGGAPSTHAMVPSAPAVPLPPAPARKAAKPLRKRAGRGSVGIVAALGTACASAGLLLVPAAIPTRYSAAGLDWWRTRILTAAAAASRSQPPEAPAQPPANPPRVLPISALATTPLAPDLNALSEDPVRPALAPAEPDATRPPAAPPSEPASSSSAQAGAPETNTPPPDEPVQDTAQATTSPAPTSPIAAQPEPAMAEPAMAEASQPEPEPVIVALAEPHPQLPSAPPTPSTPPVPQPVLARPAPPPDPAALAMADTMTRRGRAMLELGDVSAARLLLERAAAAGSGPAALAMGTTFDPATLSRLGTMGVRPDPAQAAQWYRLALTRGEPQARAMLDALPTGIATSKPGSPQ